MINQMSDIKYQKYILNLEFFYLTSFVSSKRSYKKRRASTSLAVETTLKNSESSEILYGQFPLSLRFLASSKKPTSLWRFLIPLYEHASKPSLTKRDIKSDLFERRELSTYTSDLNSASKRSLAATLALPFLQKVTKTTVEDFM